MTIKLEDIRVGDKVTLKEGVVTGIVTAVRGFDSPYPLTIDFSEERDSFALSSIATHTPAPREFKRGDMVTWGFGGTNWEFIEARGEHAILWLEKDRQTLSRAISALRHADPAPAPQEAGKAEPPKDALQAERFWMVNGNGPSSYRHETREAADKEALRLAERNTGTTFYVLEVVGAALMGAVERAVEIVEPSAETSFKLRREGDDDGYPF